MESNTLTEKATLQELVTVFKKYKGLYESAIKIKEKIQEEKIKQEKIQNIEKTPTELTGP